MLEKLTIQNRKCVFFITQENKIRSNLEKIINNIEPKIKNSGNLPKDFPILIDKVLKELSTHLNFLYIEKNKTPYITVKILDFEVGTFQIGKPTQIYNGVRITEGFTTSDSILYDVADQIIGSILDNLFPIINTLKTNGQIKLNEF